MHLPGQFGVQSHAKLFRCSGVWYDFAIHYYRNMMTPFVGQIHMCRLIFIKFN
jgi:hypothetical protein